MRSAWPMRHRSIASLLSRPGAAARWRACREIRSELEGLRLFLFPDSQLEVPLARFLHRELGHATDRGRYAVSAQRASRGRARVVAGGYHRQRGPGRRASARSHARRLSPIWWFADWGWLIRSRRLGIATKWSIELLFTPIHGYDQAGDCAQLFARPLRRRAALTFP